MSGFGADTTMRIRSSGLRKSTIGFEKSEFLYLLESAGLGEAYGRSKVRSIGDDIAKCHWLNVANCPAIQFGDFNEKHLRPIFRKHDEFANLLNETRSPSGEDQRGDGNIRQHLFQKLWDLENILSLSEHRIPKKYLKAGVLPAVCFEKYFKYKSIVDWQVDHTFGVLVREDKTEDIYRDFENAITSNYDSDGQSRGHFDAVLSHFFDSRPVSSLAASMPVKIDVKERIFNNNFDNEYPPFPIVRTTSFTIGIQSGSERISSLRRYLELLIPQMVDFIEDGSLVASGGEWASAAPIRNLQFVLSASGTVEKSTKGSSDYYGHTMERVETLSLVGQQSILRSEV